MPFVKPNNYPPLYLTGTWRAHNIQVSQKIWCCTEKSATAGLEGQWSLTCTWSNMSVGVWFSYKVIKVAICLHCLGEEKDFFMQSSEKALLFKQSWIYRAPSKVILGAKPEDFLWVSQYLALFPPNKTGPRYESVKGGVVSHLTGFELYITFPMAERSILPFRVDIIKQ